MREDVMEWGKSVLTPALVTGKRVLEVGSLDVNGSLRRHIETLDPIFFVGVDIVLGPGVDRVLDVKDLMDTYGPKKWDLVFSTEMLEHCFEWQDAVYQMKESLVEGGWLVLTTVGPGFPNHDFPSDFWRFTQEVMEEALDDLVEVNVFVGLDKEPSVFAVGRREGLVYKPKGTALPAPTKTELSTDIYIWPELEQILGRAADAINAGQLNANIVRQAFDRFNQRIRR